MRIVIADPSWIAATGLARAIELLIEPTEIHIAANAGLLSRQVADHADTAFIFIDDTILADDEETVFGRLRKLAPAAAVGVLVGATDRERVLKAIYFGAIAIIEKSADEATVIGTLRAVFAGQAAFPRSLLDSTPPAGARTSRGGEPAGERDDLTPREREIIGHVGTGKTVARIAADLQLSPHTVRVHVTRIMKKLDLRDRSALIHYAVKRNERGGRRGAAPPGLS